MRLLVGLEVEHFTVGTAFRDYCGGTTLVIAPYE